MIEEAFRDKTIFITGTTGFLDLNLTSPVFFRQSGIGKANTKDVAPTVRLQKAILNSKCFDRCRKEISNFNQFVSEKLIPVEGDIIREHFGINDADLFKITNEVDIVINNAASIDFDSRVDINMRINAKGSMNVLKFSKACKNIQALCHVSTAYVASNQPDGFIEEKIEEDHSLDLDMFVESLLQMPVEEIELKEKDIIGKFPNTYTYTKNIGEKLLKKHRGDLPMVIIRPSIIGAAAYEPCQGWVDTISAATAVYLTGAIGMVRDLNGIVDYIGDQIPVDFCSNLIIAATADIINKNELIIYHSASSSRNPITWIQTIRYLWPYVSRNQFEKRILDPYFDMYQSNFLFKSAFFLKRKVPAEIYSYVSKLIGNEQMKKDSERYLKGLNQCQQIAHYFTHFTNNEWIYDTYNSYQLKARLSDADIKIFYFDIGDIKWKDYFAGFAYGLQKYILKDELETPQGDRQSLISTRPRLFGDLMWVYYHGQPQKTRNHNEVKKILLNNPNVKATIRAIIDKEITSSTLGEPKLLKIQLARSVEILDRLAARLNYTKMRMLGYVMHKAYKSMYEKVIINKSGINRIKDLSKDENNNIILCPTHRSYMDFLIISYILYSQEISVPHICAGDDFLNIALIHTFLRNSGAFFMKRSFKDDPLYKTIFTEYVQMLLGDKHSLEFFVEGTRARSGKMLNPKFGLLNVLTNSYFQKKVENLYFVPITINYSRVLEGETFPLELQLYLKIS